jgi:hypothetical protein
MVDLFVDRQNSRCAERIHEVCAVTLRGNHDDTALKQGALTLPAAAAVRAAKMIHRRADGTIVAAHASLRDPRSWWEIFSLDDYGEELAEAGHSYPTARLVCLGHLHEPLLLQRHRRTREITVLLDGCFIGQQVFRMDPACLYLAIPGPVSDSASASLRGYGLLYRPKEGELQFFRARRV